MYRTTDTLLGPKLEKFGSGFFNGTVVRVDHVSAHRHIEYSDGDSESLSENELEQYIVE